MSGATEPGNFELIRDGLLCLDPDTRHEVIEAMKVVRTLPVPVAARILARAGTIAAEVHRPLIVMPG